MPSVQVIPFRQGSGLTFRLRIPAQELFTNGGGMTVVLVPRNAAG